MLLLPQLLGAGLPVAAGTDGAAGLAAVACVGLLPATIAAGGGCQAPAWLRVGQHF